MTWEKENVQSFCSLPSQSKIEYCGWLAHHAKVKSSRMGTAPRVVHLLVKKFSLTATDLFAFHLNHEVSVFFLFPVEITEPGQQMLCCEDSQRGLLYAFLSFFSPQQNAGDDQKRSSTGNSCISFWPRRPWFSRLLERVQSPPSVFHLKGYDITRPIMHQNPNCVSLAA